VQKADTPKDWTNNTFTRQPLPYPPKLTVIIPLITHCVTLFTIFYPTTVLQPILDVLDQLPSDLLFGLPHFVSDILKDLFRIVEANLSKHTHLAILQLQKNSGSVSLSTRDSIELLIAQSLSASIFLLSTYLLTRLISSLHDSQLAAHTSLLEKFYKHESAALKAHSEAELLARQVKHDVEMDVLDKDHKRKQEEMDRLNERILEVIRELRGTQMGLVHALGRRVRRRRIRRVLAI
jgi:hypothetical protein